MCTLIIAWRVFPEAPIVVAANRDEAVDRPSRPPEIAEGSPTVVAPRDGRAGGTWIGYNDAGLFAGISNRWTAADLAGDRSRGKLVDAALARQDAESAARAIEAAVRDDGYAGFNLVLADADTAMLLTWDGRLGVRPLEPGVHVVMNAGYDDEFSTDTDRPEAATAQAESAGLVLDALAGPRSDDPTAWLERAKAVLGDHEYGVCIHGDEFGTRSASLILLRPDGTATYRFADGPPCETPFDLVGGEGVEGQS